MRTATRSVRGLGFSLLAVWTLTGCSSNSPAVDVSPSDGRRPDAVSDGARSEGRIDVRLVDLRPDGPLLVVGGVVKASGPRTYGDVERFYP
jgi:hypothetical protein